MITLNHVTRRFGEKVAVNDVSLSVAPGEIFSLIGANGSGKTTIIKMIAGILLPSQGAITVSGEDTVANPIKTKAEIGYIPDEPASWPGMTGEEFLHFVGALYHVPEETRRKKITELLPLFKLDGSETELFDGYSRGNKKQFSILAALLHEPKVLLIDEPIVGLDVESARRAKDVFQRFAKEGGSIFLVTHTLPVAEAISDRIGILKQGKLIAIGTLEEVRHLADRGPTASLEELYTLLNT